MDGAGLLKLDPRRRWRWPSSPASSVAGCCSRPRSAAIGSSAPRRCSRPRRPFEMTVRVSSFLVLVAGLLTAWAQGYAWLGLTTGWMLASLILSLGIAVLVPTVFLPKRPALRRRPRRGSRRRRGHAGASRLIRRSDPARRARRRACSPGDHRGAHGPQAVLTRTMPRHAEPAASRRPGTLGVVEHAAIPRASAVRHERDDRRGAGGGRTARAPAGEGRRARSGGGRDPRGASTPAARCVTTGCGTSEHAAMGIAMLVSEALEPARGARGASGAGPRGVAQAAAPTGCCWRSRTRAARTRPSRRCAPHRPPAPRPR